MLQGVSERFSSCKYFNNRVIKTCVNYSASYCQNILNIIVAQYTLPILLFLCRCILPDFLGMHSIFYFNSFSCARTSCLITWPCTGYLLFFPFPVPELLAWTPGHVQDIFFSHLFLCQGLLLERLAVHRISPFLTFSCARASCLNTWHCTGYLLFLPFPVPELLALLSDQAQDIFFSCFFCACYSCAVF